MLELFGFRSVNRICNNEMEKAIALLLVLAVCVAHCAVINEKAPEHPREKRSCYECDENDDIQRHRYGRFEMPPPPPGPPPPPPFFTAHHWTGLSRNAHGVPQGVYSGAAASADLGPQSAGQAFSLASSSAGGEGDIGGSRGYGTKSAGYSGPNSANLAASGVGSGRINGNAGLSNAGPGSAGSGSNGGYGSGYGGSSNSFGAGIAGGSSGYGVGARSESNKIAAGGAGGSSGLGAGVDGGSSGFGTQVGSGLGGYGSGAKSESSNFGGGSGSGFGGFGTGRGSGSFGGRAAGSGSGSEYGGSGNGEARNNQGFGGQQRERDNFGTGINGQGQSSGFGQPQSNTAGFPARHNVENFGGYGGRYQASEHSFQDGNAQQQVQSESQGKWQQGNGYRSGYNSGGSSQGKADGHEALSGALNLASQGLQTASETGCSTCSKGYALSNARSKSGDAVALSIGG